MDLRTPTQSRLLLIALPGPLREELAGLLSLQGHELDLADSVEQAAPQLGRKHAVALIALEDERLDGLAAARALRRLAPELPLLALTPSVERAMRVRCLNAGFDDLLACPVDALELRIRLRGLVRSASATALEREVTIAKDRQCALGTLGGAVAHDLCNRAVRLTHQLDELFEQGSTPLPTQAELRATLAEVVAASRQFSNLARLSRHEPAEPLNLTDEVRRTLELLVKMGPLHPVELVLHADEEAWIWAERARIEQLVCNLVSAALESLADLPANSRTIAVHAERRGETIGLRVEAIRPAGVVRNLARPRSSPRALGLGPAAVQALAASCGGRTALEPTFSGQHALVVILPQCQAPESLAARSAG